MHAKSMPSNQRGAVLPATLLWILFIMTVLAATHAVGQAVARRAALQHAVDAAAYTGASAMAVGMNALARINDSIRRQWPLALAASTSGVPCVASGYLTALYDVRVAALSLTYIRLNSSWRDIPAAEARRVSNFNLNDLFPFEGGFTMGETDRELGLVMQRDREVLVRSRQETTQRDWTCTIPTPPYQLARSHNFRSYFVKSDRQVKAFAWVMRAPAAEPQLGAGLFSLPVVPPMKAAAAAKPIAGTIKTGDASYVAKMVPLSSVGITVVSGGRHVHH
jgi:hypothetical protein